MLQRIIDFSVNNKLIIGIATLALIGVGIYQVQLLPIDAVPDITENQVQIITVSPALGAPDVERFITFPIEQANSNIPGLKEIRSFSRFGLSVVTCVFNDETDVYWARQQVTERLQQVTSLIPPGAGTPELAPVTTGLGEIYQYAVRTKDGFEDQYTLEELRSIQDWIVRRQLLGIEGVADVSSFGGKLKEYEVIVNTQKLAATGITISEICNALEKNNGNTGGAYIEKGPSALFIRTEGLLQSIEDIEHVAIRNNSTGTPLLIQDVAEVKVGHAKRYGALCFNNDGEVAGAIVMMLKGANSSDVIQKVKARVEEIQKTLPEGVIIEPFLDRTKMVNNAIGTVEKNLLEGALIVVLILVIFLGNIRAGFIVASVIPLSMLFAICLMNLFGVSGNLMSLGALDFGLIVDGAVIIVEAVLHRLVHSRHAAQAQRITQQEMNHTVQQSAGRMMRSAVFGQIIILIVYLPILTLRGIEGKMFTPMALTVAFALMGAFILSLTYIPMMTSWVTSKTISSKPTLSDRMMARIESGYSKIIRRWIQHPKKIISITIVAFLVSLALSFTLGGEFIPELEEGDFAVDTRILTGSNLNTSIEHTQKAVRILRDSFPEIEKIVTKIGSGEIPTDPMPIEAADMMILLKDKKEWTSARTFDELAEKMSAKLSALPGISFGFQFPVQMRFNELMTGARQDVVCKIFGENMDTLSALAERLGRVSRKVEGATDVYVEQVGGMPQIVIQPDRTNMSLQGITMEDLNTTIQSAYAGSITGMLFEDERRFNITVKLDKSVNHSEENIGELLVTNHRGQSIPIRQIAKIQKIDGPNQIQREDAKRRIMVGFNVRGKDVESVVQELITEVNQKIKLPAGYYIQYGGSFENMKEASKRLSVAVPLSLALILLMLYFAFGSFKDGLIIFSAIPFSAIGGILALVMLGMPFSISAGIGFIALFGVAVLNGIVLIAEFNRLIAEEQLGLDEAVLKGLRTRLRPVLMTAAVASMGFLPMAISHGAGAEVQRPLATVVIGGLLTATLLTLIVLPNIYLVMKRRKKKTIAPLTTVLLLLLGLSSNAQTYSLTDAVQTADRHERVLWFQKQIQIREAEATNPMNELGWNITTEAGQLNTSLFDTRLAIQRNISNPLARKRRSAFFEKMTEQAKIQEEIARFMHKLEIEAAYYNWQLASRKISLFDEFLEAILRAEMAIKQNLQSGNTSASQLAFMSNERLQLEAQRSRAVLEQAQIKNLLHWLTGFDSQLQPQNDTVAVLINAPPTEITLQNNRFIRIQKNTLEVLDREKAVISANALPTFQLGGSNMSIRGWETIGNQDIYHMPSDRFTSVNFSIQWPRSRKATKNDLEVNRLQIEQQQLKLSTEESLLSTEYQNALNNWLAAHDMLNHQRDETMLNAKIIMRECNLQLEAGSISWIEWSAMMRQALQSRLSLLDLTAYYNETAIQLKTLLNNE